MLQILPLVPEPLPDALHGDHPDPVLPRLLLPLAVAEGPRALRHAARLRHVASVSES